MYYYRNLYESIASRRHFISFGGARRLSKGNVDISDRTADVLKRTLKGNDFVAYPTVDTKDRVIRTVITLNNKSPVIRISATCSANDRIVMKWLYNEIYRIGGDVITAQIRTSAQIITPTSEEYFDNSLHLIDLTFHLPIADEKKIGEILDNIKNEFRILGDQDARASIKEVLW